MTTNREKPLMLKDFLELDSNSCRRSWAHNSSTGTVRYLLDAELYGGSLVRSRRTSALFSRISAIIKKLHLSSSTRTNKSTFLSKSFSQKLISGSLWKKRVKEAEKVRVKDIVRMTSFDDLCAERRSLLYLPSLLSSSNSSSCDERDGSSASAEFVLSSNSSFDCSATGEDPRDPALKSPKRNMASGGDGENKEECRGCLCQEEKEQLSPVSVMDFPYQDDTETEEATSSSPCFEQSLANIERTKHELLQKIRRFERLAELDPIDLTVSFTSVEDHVDSEEDIDLIQQLRFDGYPVGPHKKILLDFFVEGMTLDVDMEELLAAAEDWIRGHGHLDVDEHGKVQIKEMERNRRWICFEEEKEKIAADVEVELLGSLVDELVLDALLLGLPQLSK